MSQLNDDILRFRTDMSKTHDFVHGDALSAIQTESGLVPTLAKLVADKKVDIDIAAADYLKAKDVEINASGNGLLQQTVEVKNQTAAIRDSINNRLYPGIYTVVPTTRPDGTAIQNGDEYLDATYRYVRRAGAWVNYEKGAVDAANSATASKSLAETNAAAAANASATAASANTNAQAAALAAAAARDAINTTGKVFSDTTTGIAGTTTGQSFSVVDASLQFWIVYKNNAGVAQELVRTYSKSYIDNLGVRPTIDNSNHYQRWSDDAGYVNMYLDALGLHADTWSVGASGLDTPDFTLKQDPKYPDTLRLVDSYGYGVLEVSNSTSAAELKLAYDKAINSTGLHLDPFEIVASKPTVDFAVTDGYGYFAVYVPKGKSIGDTTQMAADIAALKAGTTGATSFAGIPTSRMPIVAHRGTTIGGIAPEDSLDSYMHSARAGYRMVETDIQRTLDNQYVIMHDNTVNRTMKNKADYSTVVETVDIGATDLATLRANFVLASANPRQRRPLPTLDEFCALCRDYNLYPVMELKDWRLTNTDITNIFNIACKYLGDGGFAFTSFFTNMLDFSRSLSSKIGLWYIYDVALTPLSNAAIDNVKAHDGVAYSNYGAWTDDLIAYAKSQHVPVTSWTVPNAEYDGLRKRGMEQFATDTIAPPLDNQKVIFRDFSDLAFSSFSNTGTLLDGMVTLAAGQSLLFTKSSQTKVGFGANYFSFDLKGVANVVATRCSKTVTNNGDNFQTAAFQCLMYNESFTLMITAGAGGCVIKDIYTAIASFD